jgi:hypothetical protein
VRQRFRPQPRKVALDRLDHAEADHENDRDAGRQHEQEDGVPAEEIQGDAAERRREGGADAEDQPHQVHDAG